MAIQTAETTVPNLMQNGLPIGAAVIGKRAAGLRPAAAEWQPNWIAP
jgi:hypothetical protein